MFSAGRSSLRSWAMGSSISWASPRASGGHRFPNSRNPSGPGAASSGSWRGLFVLTSAALIAVGAPTWWWLIAGCGAMVSQVAIVISWSDAKAGTLVNVCLVLVASYGFLSVGPTSFHAQWQERATHALTEADPAPGRS